MAVFAGFLGSVGQAEAQAASAPPALPAESPGVAEPTAPASTPPPPAPSVELEAPAPPDTPPPAPPPEPEKEEPTFPSLKVGIGVRTGLALSFNNPKPDDNVQLTLYDGLGSQLTVRPYFGGELTKHIGLTANFEATASEFHIMDAIVRLKFFDELQLWVGQHIPANDRTAFCGPFYHNGWNFPITVLSYPFDHDARDRGFTFWGLIAGGIIKYHLSVVDLQTKRAIGKSRIGGRVTVNLLDPENYYYSSGTYYGAQDTLAIGGVFQYQSGSKGVDADGDGVIDGDTNKNGKLDNDFFGFSFDLLFEKNLHGAGTITLEGGYWNFKGSGKEYVVNQGSSDVGLGVTGPQPAQSYLVALSWLTPGKVGYGHIQPNARLQANDATGDPKVIDVGLAYVIDGFNHRWHVNYRHVDQKGANNDMFQFGAQLQL